MIQINQPIDWEAIEEVCMNTEDLPDCIPVNIRQWDAFIKQYERAVELVNGKWEPHYDWETEEEFHKVVNEQFYLGKGYKNSIYECNDDIRIHNDNFAKHRLLFKNVDWDIVQTAWRFTTCITISNLELTELPLLPKKVCGSFDCSDNQLMSLEGCPEYVGGDFYCEYNQLTSLKGCPEYVGEDFYCNGNFNKLPDSIPISFPGKDLHKYRNL